MHVRDSLPDYFYGVPLGTGNMRDTVFMSLHVCQMMGYEDIMNSYKLITHNAARTLHLGEKLRNQGKESC